MATSKTGRRPLLEELEELAHARFPEGLVRRLEHHFHGHDRAAEDAVAEAVSRMVKKGGTSDIGDPRAYLAATAFNAMRQAAKRKSNDELSDRSLDEKLIEDEVLIRETFRYIKSLVEAWQSRNLKTTTLLVIDSTYLGEPLTTAELCEHLEVILGEEVAVGTAKKWKERGLRRIDDQLNALGLLD